MTFRPFEVRVVDWEREPHQTDVLYVWHGGFDLPTGGRLVRVVRTGAGAPAAQLFDFRRS